MILIFLVHPLHSSSSVQRSFFSVGEGLATLAEELEYKIGFAKLLGTVVVDLISVGINPPDSVILLLLLLLLPINDKLRNVGFVVAEVAVAVFWLQLLERDFLLPRNWYWCCQIYSYELYKDSHLPPYYYYPSLSFPRKKYLPNSTKIIQNILLKTLKTNPKIEGV